MMRTGEAPIRVLVVEDSPTQRAFLCRSLEADGDIVVVGQAATAVNAVALAQHAQPDVVTMDLNIPGGGLSAITRIMESSPRPILLLSGQVLGPRSPEAVDALGAGAVGVLVKPRRWDDESQRLLRGRIRTLRRVRPTRTRSAPAASGPTRPRATLPPVVGIGSSTGGPAALATVLRDLGSIAAPVLCVQHIDDRQTEGLAHWLSVSTGRDVRLATHGAIPEVGVVYVGPGGSHLTLGADRRIVLDPDRTSLHTPSVDRLLLSLAQTCGARAVGCLLTGMGTDGAAGLCAMSEAGAFTIAQDEATSVVFGMAAAAVERGAVRRLLPIEAVGIGITRAVRGML